MRVLIAIVCAGLLLPAAASAKRADCWPRGTKTLAQSSKARVYWRGHEHSPTFACLYRTGRSVQLDHPSDDYATYVRGPYTLRGKFVAYTWDAYPLEPYSYRPTQVAVTNLLHRKTYWATSWGPDDENDRDEPPHGRTLKLVVRPNGDVAWTSWNELNRGQPELWAMTSGQPRLVDSGDGLDARSLKLDGARITWKHDGKRRSAAFR